MKKRTIYEINMILYKIDSNEVWSIAKDIIEEISKICNGEELESIAFGTQELILYFGGNRTGVLKLIGDVGRGAYDKKLGIKLSYDKEGNCVQYKEYPFYRYEPKEIYDEEVQRCKCKDVNVYKFTSILLKLANTYTRCSSSMRGEIINKCLKYMYVLNAILHRRVFVVERNKWSDNCCIKHMNLQECIECIDNKEFSFWPKELYSYIELKEKMDTYICEELKCICENPISISVDESKEYYDIIQKIVAGGGRIKFGQYEDVSIELLQYDCVFQICFKVGFLEDCYHKYCQIMDDAVQGKALELEDIRDYNDEYRRKSIVFNAVQSISRVAEKINAVVCYEDGNMIWTEVFYCEEPTTDKLWRRIQEAFDRIHELFIRGERKLYISMLNEESEVRFEAESDFYEMLDCFADEVLIDQI